MRLLGLLVAAAAAASGACGSTSRAGYVVVTIDARPAVHDAASVSVTLGNAGTMRTDTLMLGGKSFPVTFSISAPGRTGALAITVDASDASGLVIGHGSAMASIADSTANVMLDSTDFVVNTDFAGDQFPTDDSQASGFQLAALPDGTWTTVFRDSCMQSACNVRARRFSPTGKPAATDAAAGANAFIVTARPSDLFTEAAVASNQNATIALWNFTDPSPSTATGVACRTLSTPGVLGADQVALINTDQIADAVSVVALPSGDFAVAWNALPDPNSSNVIRAAFIHADCSVLVAAKTVSTGTAFVDRNAVAASADQVLFTWVISGDLHARLASSSGTLSATELPLVLQTATDEIAQARLAAMPGGGFAIAVRWVSKSSPDAPGKIELYQVSATGAVVGAPALVTDQSGSNFYDSQGFGFAGRTDGTVMVAWHTCNTGGDLCTLSGRILHATGEPVTDAFAIPTTAGGSQKLPSVVGLPDAFAVVWSDSSGKPPDTSGQAVRARILYPPGAD